MTEGITLDAPATTMGRGRRALCLVLLTVLGFSLGCSEFIVIGIEPDIARDFGVPLATAGQLMSFFAVAYAACTPLLGIVTGRFRRFQLLVAYSLVFCGANVVQVLAPTFELLLVARVLIGSVSGALLAVGVTYIPELVGVRRMSIVISVVYAAFSVAMVISTSAGKMLAEFAHWHVAIVGALVMAVATCVALVCVLPREGTTDQPAHVADQLALLREPTLLVGIAIFVFGVGSVYVFYGYVTPYLEEVLGMDAVAASGTLMAYGAVTLVSNLASGWLDARFGLRALRVTFPIQAVVLLALFLAGGRAGLAVAAIMCVALTMYFVSVPCISLFMRVARERHPKAMTLASSIEPMAFNIGIAFGTAMGGVVVSGPGLPWCGLVGACFSLLACGLVCATLAISRRAEARMRDAARDAA